MSHRFTSWASVDEHGRLKFDPRLMSRLGLQPGVKVHLVVDDGEIKLSRPVTQLSRVYIEPTNQCNLNCRICVRNGWDEPSGQMSAATFQRVIEGIKKFSPRPTAFFGGFGEPLTHPKIVDMVAQVKAAGAGAELITNGMLLTEGRADGLIKAGLDVLWISIDGARPESYADIRLGAELPGVLENVRRFSEKTRFCPGAKPEIGIVFVAMRRNIADLPALLELGSQVGASQYLVTNLLPYTLSMCSEILYTRALGEPPGPPSPSFPEVELPRFDLNLETLEPLFEAARSVRSLKLAGKGLPKTEDRCPFIARGAVAISWDGDLSPCLPLMHTHTSYWDNRPRISRRYVVGNVDLTSLDQIWYQQDYIDFRHKVQDFDFSPCVVCWSCYMAEANEEDCYGNLFPTCGGCLWAQGVIQCP